MSRIHLDMDKRLRQTWLHLRKFVSLATIFVAFVAAELVIFSCSDEAVAINDERGSSGNYTPGANSGTPLQVSFDLDGDYTAMETRNIYTTDTIDSIVVLLSNHSTTIYNPNNHSRKFGRSPLGSNQDWKSTSPLFVGGTWAHVLAYAPDTASLISDASDTIWMYIDKEFNTPRADTIQADYLYASATERDTVNFITASSKRKTLTMNHALSKVDLYFCNLKRTETAKTSFGNFTYYSGVGDIHDAYLCTQPTSSSSRFLTKAALSLGPNPVATFPPNPLAVSKNGIILQKIPVSGTNTTIANYSDTLHWGHFTNDGSGRMLNIGARAAVSSPLADTARYSALVSPGTYNNLTAGAAIDGTIRFRKIANTVTFVRGKSYSIYVTVCNSSADSLMMLDVYVMEWEDMRSTIFSGTIIGHYSDTASSWTNFDAMGRPIWEHRVPYMYDGNQLVYEIITVSPGVYSLRWSYPTDIYYTKDGFKIVYNRSANKVYCYNSSGTLVCVIYE